MKHEAKLTISRPTYGDGRKKISMTVEDEDAGIQFLELEIDLDSFAEAITGLSHVPCEIEFRGLKNVGKKIERDTLEFELPKEHYSMGRDEVKKLALQKTPDGWHCSCYFGSQRSFFTKDGKSFARTSISRWVDKPDTKTPK